MRSVWLFLMIAVSVLIQTLALQNFDLAPSLMVTVFVIEFLFAILLFTQI